MRTSNVTANATTKQLRRRSKVEEKNKNIRSLWEPRMTLALKLSQWISQLTGLREK